MGGRFDNRRQVISNAGERREELRGLLHSADAAATEAWFRARPESERREVAAYCLKWFKTVHGHCFSYPEKPRPDIAEGAEAGDAFLAALVAWFASTNAPAALKRQGWRGIPRPEYVLAIARDRQPEWIDAWVEIISENSLRDWPLVRSMVVEGLCKTPTCEGYTLGMISSFSGYYNRGGATTEKMLRADPALFEDEIWRIFRVEGNADASLSMARGWTEALLALVADGTLDRARVLRETLGALSRDFSKHKAGFYSRFYEKLGVSDEERIEHVSPLLGLLASRIGPTQTLALRELTQLFEEGHLDLQGFVAASSPALRSRTKGTSLAVLHMLGEIALRRSELAHACCTAALDAFDQVSPDVHARVVDLFETHATREVSALTQALEERLDDVAVSQRGRVEAWLGLEGEADVAVQTDLPALIARAEMLPADVQKRYGLAALCEPDREFQALPETPWLRRRCLIAELDVVADTDALIDLVAHVVEGKASPDDVERAIDGVFRLCAERPENFAERSGPLRKRVLSHIKKVRNFASADMQADTWRLAYAWLTGECELAASDTTRSFAFWQRRILRIVKRVASKTPGILLSTPTHTGGWIDPRTFVRRACEIPVADWEVDDAILGLLRLAPEHRACALSSAHDIAGEYGAAVRHALGATGEAVGETATLWAAASRARNPDVRDEAVLAKHPHLGADGAEPCDYQAVVQRQVYEHGDGLSGYRGIADDDPREDGRPSLVIERSPPVREPLEAAFLAPLLQVEGSGDLPGEHYLRWLATTWPASRDGWFARGALALYGNMNWGGAAWENAVYLETLFDHPLPFRPMAALCLAVGLTAKEPREVALATDVLIAAIGDGRVSGAMLGGAMRRLCHKTQNRKYKWPSPRPKGARWARTLGEAAAVSALHSEEIRVAIECSICFGTAEHALKDQSALLSLLRELCMAAQCGVQRLAARAFLGTYAGSSKTAKLAKACLALEGGRSCDAAEARAIALEARLALAENGAELRAR